jgi:hypothetical protein
MKYITDRMKGGLNSTSGSSLTGKKNLQYFQKVYESQTKLFSEKIQKTPNYQHEITQQSSRQPYNDPDPTRKGLFSKKNSNNEKNRLGKVRIQTLM